MNLGPPLRWVLAALLAVLLALALTPAQAEEGAPVPGLPKGQEYPSHLDPVEVPSPQTHGSSALELAPSIRAEAQQVLGHRYVELWMGEDQRHLVVGVIGLGKNEALGLAKKISPDFPLEVVARHVSRQALEAVAKRVEKTAHLRERAVISRNYEAGVVSVQLSASQVAPAVAALRTDAGWRSSPAARRKS